MPQNVAPTGGQPAVDARFPFVVLRAGGAFLAFESKFAQSFAELPEEIPLPLAPPHIRGVSVINGAVVPLLDIARFLEIADPARAADDRGGEVLQRRLVVVSDAGMTVGIICDQIGFLIMDSKSVARPGAVLGGRLGEFAVAQVERGADVIAVMSLGDLLEAARVGT